MSCTGPGATHHYACDCREREREADRRQLAVLTAVLSSLRSILGVDVGEDVILAASQHARVVNAARALRDSGYDGPFMGEAVEPLFAALAALDGEEAER